ncbi:flagellar biosynthesis protein FlhB [Balneatrix alpica]|uniref:Flagellar biosynthetic protein FlhB n=1 Tax=Balneatrix alpica TaxID=75684 RepID=A0ABV5ZHD3_9GAMM|nr:flagellar biosynthesis protein FlhB [Balneatrix alpica]
MAEQEGQEKTEQPTSKRLEEARGKGDVPRSRELTTVLLLLTSVAFVFMFGGHMVDVFSRILRFNLELDEKGIKDTHSMFLHFEASAWEATLAVSGLVLALGAISIAATVLVGGWNFSSEALMPQLSRMNPLSGIKRMFSVQSLIELLKAIGKFVIVASVAVALLWFSQDDLLLMGRQDVEVAMAHGADMLLWGFLFLSSAMVLIAMLDVPFQLYQYTEKLKMTKQEVRDEMKNSEGNPEVKGRIRRLQREMSMRRMMANVPKADVVITNPTHFAVALQYSGKGAPILVAKGEDMIAAKIREIAEAYNVPMLSAPPLARSIYYTTELDQEIPGGLYIAVAQVLAYVSHLRAWRRRQGPKPVVPKNLPIPDDLRRDEERPT